MFIIIIFLKCLLLETNPLIGYQKSFTTI